MFHNSEKKFKLKVGYEADCGDPICCRPPHAPHENQPVNRPAGYFGDYQCDSPRSLAESVLNEALSRFPELDFVIMTG